MSSQSYEQSGSRLDLDSLTISYGLRGAYIKGIFTQKPFAHGSRESLSSLWLRVSHASTLGLHDGSFGSTTHNIYSRALHLVPMGAHWVYPPTHPPNGHPHAPNAGP